MLISRVPDEGAGGQGAEHDHSHEYQTASELFDLMARDHPFEPDAGEPLSTRDLVILYKNIDLGTNLMSDAEEFKRRRPNQHVETVVYNDDLDSDSSGISEIYSNDDLNNVFSVNNERINLFNNRPSLENTLCQKLGDLEIQASKLSLEYDQHFLFKDPYIKEQLRNWNHLDGEIGTALPASLLDYICCKRLEDNYNFYMDNIIRYVQHTIEQLKRISNGDYLTERAKEKWREVEHDSKGDDKNTKVLATSTSIPLQVERKVNGHSTTWDDIIHSEVDVRSLSKILEKKIIVEIPKLICGSYKLFSKFCSENLIISCKRKEEPVTTENNKESRVDVVLQLERSKSGQVMSNISSIMILQATPAIQIRPLVERPPPLPLPYAENEDKLPYEVNKENTKIQIIEICESTLNDNENVVDGNSTTNRNDKNPVRDFADSNHEYYNVSKSNSIIESEDSSVALRDILDTRPIPNILRKEAPYNFISPDELSLSMHKLNMSALPEESGDDVPQNQTCKKKSATKIRIKSPYENKSFIMEEKKRKKLLEIREKREKKKMAVGENCKISKHRYGKGIMPSSSVTNLSITNKSFYNSIYGQNINFDNKSTKSRGRKGKRELFIDPPLEQLAGENESPMLTPEKNSKKYINRSYYLDEAVTEMMYTQLRQSDCSSVKEIFSASASAASGEFSGNKNKIDSSEVDLNEHCVDNLQDNFESHDANKDSLNIQSGITERHIEIKEPTSSRCLLNTVPMNSPKDEEYNVAKETPKKTVPTVECRKSIDKLYDLMKKLGKTDSLEIRPSRSRFLNNIGKVDAKVGQGSSTIQGSDSGTSIKHHLTSSNPSSFSFEKIPNPEEVVTSKFSKKKTDALTTVVPKVIISTKQQTVKVEAEKVKKERKKIVLNPLPKVPDNPLKAISQLLHEFDSVQKTRHRPPSDTKPDKKSDISFDGRIASRQGLMLKKRSRNDQPARETDIQNDKNIKIIGPRDRRPRSNSAMEPLKIPHQQIPIDEKHIDRIVKEEKRVIKEDKHLDRFSKKKIIDIIDEVKEAKGEAVRGPSKLNSRLSTLAQPKKSYVQAHSEEYNTKYGRNLMADRLQRLASAPPATIERPSALTPKNKPKRIGTEAVSSVSVRPPPPPQALERGLRLRRSASSSPEAHAAVPCKQSRATDPPDAIKNKMVAVESYVKSHFRRKSPPALGATTARVPLVPTDLDLVSLSSSPTAEESTVIGSKLHRIIDSMIHAKSTPLSALVESRESSSRHTNARDDFSLIENYSRGPSSVDSDYRADIFEDKNVKTAVESLQEKQHGPTPEAVSDHSEAKNDRKTSNSSTELQKLEDALHGRLSMGTYRKHPRINDFPVMTKRSMQGLLLMHSGDAGSVVLKSTISRSLKLSTSRSDVTADLNTLPAFEKSQLDWNFRSNIPMQIATVGYAFPEYHASYCRPNSAIRSLDNIFKLGISISNTSTKGNRKSDKTSQCFKGSQSKNDMQENTVSSLNNQEVPIPRKKQTNTASVSTDARLLSNIEKKCGDCYHLENDKCEKELKTKGKAENVDCTSSLDVLVGLLNEIQKITTCHITDTVQYTDKQESPEPEAVAINGCAALSHTVTNKHSHELVSIASLDKLRQLESSPSIYSLYLSDADKESIEDKLGIPRLNTSLNSIICDKMPSYVDKEVGVDFPVRNFTDTFTEVPSKFFPITITHSTNVTSSLVGILSKPSSQTIISLEDYESAYTDSFNFNRNRQEITERSNGTQNLYIHQLEYIENKEKVETCGLISVENKVQATELHKVKLEKNRYRNGKYNKNSDFDPLIKMKRDILVTVYSMLVITVFAALSFPELLYHI